MLAVTLDDLTSERLYIQGLGAELDVRVAALTAAVSRCVPGTAKGWWWRWCGERCAATNIKAGWWSAEQVRVRCCQGEGGSAVRSASAHQVCTGLSKPVGRCKGANGA